MKSSGVTNGDGATTAVNHEKPKFKVSSSENVTDVPISNEIGTFESIFGLHALSDSYTV